MYFICVCMYIYVYIGIHYFQIFSLSYARFSSTFSSKFCTKPGIISIFLIHSGSLQKMLTALFDLVWSTQKSKWTIFF